MSGWQPPHVNFERKIQFCMTKAEAHEVYNLNCAGQDPKLLNKEDFSNEDWLQVFTEVPKRGSKVKCRFVKTEFWSKFYSMFTSVYQEPPENYGMEVTKAFATGFLYEHLKGAVNWAAFAESIVANMKSSKLQLKKQRWAAFHSSIASQSSHRMTMVSNVDDGDASKGSGLLNVAKFPSLGNFSLNELDNVGMAVALSQANALTHYQEACKKRDVMQVNMHRNEGEMSIIQSVTKQLVQAKDRLGELQSSRAGSVDVDRETTRIFKLEMTLETLQAEVVDNDCSSEVLEINREIAMMDEIIPILNARVNFVNDMKRKKSSFHLQVPAPKVPPPNAEIWQVPDSCNACGMLMYDEEVLGIFILPCKHAYHIYYFANLAGREEKCLAASYGHVIPDNIKESMFIDSGGNTSTGCLKFESSSKKKKEPQVLSTKANDSFGKPLLRDTQFVFTVCLSCDGLGSDMYADIVTFHDEGYESDEEASSCSDGGETVDDELKFTDSSSYLSSNGDDMEEMHEEASGLTVAEAIYDVDKDALELKSQQEGEQGLVSYEKCMQPVLEKSENASVEEVMSFCDGESVCEAVEQVEGLFDDGVDDIGFFDNLMLEASDDVSFSSSLDTGMLENVTCEFFDRLLDEEVPLAIIIVAQKKNDACADVPNVFKGVICLLAGMYAFQCLLKAAFVAHDNVTGVSKPLKYNIPYVAMNMVFCADDYKERSFMMHMHAYGKAIDGVYGTRLLCSISTGFPWEPGSVVEENPGDADDKGAAWLRFFRGSPWEREQWKAQGLVYGRHQEAMACAFEEETVRSVQKELRPSGPWKEGVAFEEKDRQGLR
ncbi:hypothetical protein L7F22_038340 [Adiantum nelumboides]|nr:hypothetical protein [Adiantum nelumboides]